METHLANALDAFFERYEQIHGTIEAREQEKRREEQRIKEYEARAAKAFDTFRIVIDSVLAKVCEAMAARSVLARVLPGGSEDQVELNGEPINHLVSLIFSNPTEKTPGRMAVIRFLRGRVSRSDREEHLVVAFAPDEQGVLSREEVVAIDFIMAPSHVEFWLAKLVAKAAM